MIQYLQNFKQGPELPWEGLRGFTVGAPGAMNPGPRDLFLMALAAALLNMAGPERGRGGGGGGGGGGTAEGVVVLWVRGLRHPPVLDTVLTWVC